jgi:hypothetical protein
MGITAFSLPRFRFERSTYIVVACPLRPAANPAYMFGAGDERCRDYDCSRRTVTVNADDRLRGYALLFGRVLSPMQSHHTYTLRPSTLKRRCNSSA